MRLFVLPLVLAYVLEVVYAVCIHFALRRWSKRIGKYTRSPLLADIINLAAVADLSVVAFCNIETVVSMWMLFAFLTLFVAQTVGILIYLLGKLPRLWRGKPWRYFGSAGLIAGVLVCAFMWWGALVTRLSTRVVDVNVEIKDLPRAFDGYRIVQLSDFHVGTYGKDTSFPAKVVKEVNALNPDLIVFTGDLVNSRANELPPFVDVLSQLKAKDGVISITGNHDYGDYVYWESEQKKLNDRAWLYTMHEEMGWRLLRDAKTPVIRGNDTIWIVGVENIGEPPFRAYGSLKRATEPDTPNQVKILLSHNPRHWNDSIMNNPAMGYDLTLSGHTHAMQIQFGGWSPSKYKYPQWGGLYTDTLGRKLYVNTGIGSVGMPARLGTAKPEITLLTLRRPKTN